MNAGAEFATRSLADIAATLPGATAVFRRHKLDFCCGGEATLAAAATARGLPVDQITDALAGLAPGGDLPPREPAALIVHIVQRYHDTHRLELPELIRLARRVEAVHRGHPDAPQGLGATLEDLRAELDSHMQKEEQILFPLMQKGGHPMIGHPIARMRVEHEEHGERLRRLEAITHDGVLPADACPTWAALYAGVRKLIDDLHDHVHLENNVLFPQFAGDSAQA
jgi:regulator of cell morphogenesis and NO signaling